MTLIRRSTLALLAFGLLAAGMPAAAQRGPAPVTLHVPPEVLALACAPRATYEVPLTSLKVTGGQSVATQMTWAPGDLITVNAGTDNGIEVGQEFYARRLQADYHKSPTRQSPGVIRTTGWIRIWAVDTQMSLATITHACDSVNVGDYLEPFALPDLPVPEPTENVKPQRGNYGHVLIGSDLRRTFGKGDFFAVDRGSDHGVTPGARFVIYRDKRLPQNFLYELGEAVAVSVQPESSTLEVTLSRAEFVAGDYVAIRR